MEDRDEVEGVQAWAWLARVLVHLPVAEVAWALPWTEAWVLVQVLVPQVCLWLHPLPLWSLLPLLLALADSSGVVLLW